MVKPERLSAAADRLRRFLDLYDRLNDGADGPAVDDETYAVTISSASEGEAAVLSFGDLRAIRRMLDGEGGSR